MPQTIIKQYVTYTVDELSPDALDRAHIDHLNAGDFYHWTEENRDTLKAFEEIFPVKIKDWEYGDHNFISWTLTAEPELEDLRGPRLAAWLYNNFKQYLYKPRRFYLSKKHRDSRIMLDNCCVLTGYCIDDDILEPVYKFIDRPDNHQGLYDIISDCLESWLTACRQDYEDDQSIEAFIANAEANEWTFTEDGGFFS